MVCPIGDSRCTYALSDLVIRRPNLSNMKPIGSPPRPRATTAMVKPKDSWTWHYGNDTESFSIHTLLLKNTGLLMTHKTWISIKLVSLRGP